MSFTVPRCGAPRLGEPLANRQGKARQDIATVKHSVFAEKHRTIATGIDADGSPPGIDVPYQADAGTEILVELAAPFPWVCYPGRAPPRPGREQPGGLPLSPFAFGIRRHEMNAVSGIRTISGKIRIRPSAPITFPRSWVSR